MAQLNENKLSDEVKSNENEKTSAEEGGDAIRCKTCTKTFPNLQACLLHELKHLNVTETKSKNGNEKKRRKNVKRPMRPIETVEEKEFKSLVKTALSLCDEGAELNILCRLFQPDPDNLSCIYDRVYNDLDLELGKIGKWDIEPFGSTVTGMAFKSSDMDFYIECRRKNNQDKKKLFQNVVKQLRRSHSFSRVIPVDKARVPVIKCTHDATGYNLDVNLTSKFGVYNSQFIAKILNFDTRIHPIMLIIKIWAKTWGITRTGRITNYCLTWLVFFYLENCKPAILSSVKQFQMGTRKNLVNGVNFAFNEQIKNRLLNNANIKDLVQGFFHFYTNFDFKNFIISPYLGQAIKRKDFENKTFVFPEYAAYMKLLEKNTNTESDKPIEQQLFELDISTLMVVQDPFCLNLNKAVAVRESVFNLFKTQLARAHKIFSEDNQSSSKLLIRLFYEDVPNLMDDMTSNMSKFNNTKTNAATYVCKLCAVENELVYVRTYLRKAFPERTFDKTEVNKFWIEKIVEFTIEILKVMFKINVSNISTESPTKSARVEGQSDVYDAKYSLSLELQATIDFWTSRKNDVKKGYAAFLQEQIQITKKFETERKENYHCNLNCRFDLKPDVNYSAIIINIQDLVPKNVKSNFKLFCTEYTSRMRNFYKAYFENLVRSQ